MKKILILLFILLSSTRYIAQTSISETQARKVAETFVQAKSDFGNVDLTLVRHTNVYIYDIGNQGFVMVSGNKVLPPILGYSNTNGFAALEEAPENYRAWIRHYEEMIDFAETEQLQPEASVLLKWDQVEKGIFCSKGTKTVSPLIYTHWNQDCYYNEYCPETSGGWWDGGPCGHAYAGCVACAMAQIMKYWDYPAQGYGSHSYVHGTYGELSANFGATTYQWDQMPNSIYSHNDAIATLMYHCGVSVNMNYSGSGSGAYSKDVETALRSYFGYCGAKYREKNKYDESTWISMLKSDLDKAYPIYYSGNSDNAGHAFVCDGYDDYDFFHFNFGWSGGGDDYYSLYSVNGYNNSQAAVFNIIPMDIRPDDNGIIYVSADGEGNGSSWDQATSNLEFATFLSSGGSTRIWVKKGVYYGDDNDEENAFYITGKNKVFGGFNGDEAPDYDISQRDFVNNASILDGQGIKRVLNQDELLNSASQATWNGFTIRNGYAGSGGGVYINGFVNLENCTIEDNTADAFGGGVYLNSSSAANQVYLNRCTIINNTASLGGGLCDRNGASITNCIISNNTATTKGGGIYSYNNANAILRGCIVSNNTANEGGGIYVRGRCQLFNCDIVMNEATTAHGGIFNEDQYSKYTNCIFWGNVANGDYNQLDGDCLIQYSAVQGGKDGEGNIELPAENNGEEPGVYVRFQKPTDGPGVAYSDANWKTTSRSICLNAGKPGTAGYSTDIAGHPRLQHNRVDIGAYERNASLTLMEAAIWEGEIYWFNHQPLEEPGYYTTVYQTPSCDSVVGLTLMVTLGTEEISNDINTAVILSIDIFSINGQYLGNAKSPEEVFSKHLQSGCYLLRIHTSEGIQNKKMVIQ